MKKFKQKCLEQVTKQVGFIHQSLHLKCDLSPPATTTPAPIHIGTRVEAKDKG